MKKGLYILGLMTVLVGVLPTFITACGSGQSAASLKDIEVREYQGERLSSVTDFRENSIAGPQHINIDEYKLRVSGLVDTPLELTYDDVLNNYQNYKKVITLSCVEGWSAKVLWEGVLVRDLINEAGLSPDTTTVIFYAYDGYSTSFPIDYVMDNDILLAYKMNDVTLPTERGYPFELAAESKWGYKWIRWVTNIELSDDTDYQGYWESRGYSNTGDLGKPFFD